MDSSPEMERFGISASDLEFSLNPVQNFYGNSKRNSKKKQIYGMWAEDSDESDEEFSGKTLTGRRSKRKGPNYSGPISFVSGGVKGGSGPDLKKTNESDDIDDNFTDEDIEPDVEIVQDAFPAPIKQPRFSVSSKQGKSNTKKGGFDGEFGSWERHTRGIGLKLLEKMGYETGKGLGPKGQGIVTPVQAVKREGSRQAVGYFGSEKAAAPRRGNEEPEVEPVDEGGAQKLYKKGNSDEKKSLASTKQKYIYKTASEIISENSSVSSGYHKTKNLFLKDSAMSKVKVIDMTGKEQRVYSGYHQLSRMTDKPEDDSTGMDGGSSKRIDLTQPANHFDMPVLLHNLDILVRDAEEEILRHDSRKKLEDDRQINLRHEIESLNKLCCCEQEELTRLESAIDLLDQFEGRLADLSAAQEILNPEEAALWIKKAKEHCGPDAPELSALAIAMAKPLLARTFSNWKPLQTPRFGLSMLSEWQTLLESDSAIFESLLQASWMPTVRRAILYEWNPRESETLLQLLDSWRPFLSDFMLNCLLLNQLIYPKLQAEVERWDPLTDTVPIHSWLHPWLVWLQDQLAPAHDLVRQKLGSCLAKWHPSDSSAHAILLPWKSVFQPAEMNAFLRRHILPKLELVLQQMLITPNNQNMAPWDWVIRWADLLAPAMLADLLEMHFFPKWFSVLTQWLAQAQQNTTPAAYAEIGRWYAGWKTQIPGVVAEYPGIRSNLQKALQAMERTLSGKSPIEPIRPVSSNYSSAGYVPPPSTSQFAGVPSSYVPSSLKEMLEIRCQEQGLIFHPIPSRFHEGKQIYRLGNVQVYLDRNVVFLWQGTLWQPTSISDLLKRAL